MTKSQVYDSAYCAAMQHCLKAQYMLLWPVCHTVHSMSDLTISVASCINKWYCLVNGTPIPACFADIHQVALDFFIQHWTAEAVGIILAPQH